VVDEEAVTDVAAEVAADTDTDTEALAEQAIEAAKEFEQQQAALAAERESAGVEAPEVDRTEAEEPAEG
jgi:hypothetical protein